MKETVKINKTESCFFEKINKIDKPLARLIKKKEKNQINKIRNEKGEIITDDAEIQRIIKDYFEQLYGNKIDKITWKKWTDSLKSSIFLRLNQEEIEIMNGASFDSGPSLLHIPWGKEELKMTTVGCQ